MKHRIVFTMLAKISYVFAEIHIFQVIRDKTAVATLNAFAEFFYNFFRCVFAHFLDFNTKFFPYRFQNFINAAENKKGGKKFSRLFILKNLCFIQS